MKLILNYTCENGHKWKSTEWPVSNWFASSKHNKEIVIKRFFGIPIGIKVIKNRWKETRCPECGTSIAMCQSEDGKQGAMHMGFIKKWNI